LNLAQKNDDYMIHGNLTYKKAYQKPAQFNKKHEKATVTKYIPR